MPLDTQSAEKRVRVICPHCGSNFLVVVAWVAGLVDVQCVDCDRQIVFDLGVVA